MFIDIIYVIVLVFILFGIGIFGVLTCKNIITIFMCVEMMLNSVNLLFITFSRFFNNIDGEIMVLFVMAIAAAEAAIGLALVLSLYRNFKTVNIDKIRSLKEENL